MRMALPEVGLSESMTFIKAPFQNEVKVSCPMTILPSAVAEPVATKAEQCEVEKRAPSFLADAYLLTTVGHQ